MIQAKFIFEDNNSGSKLPAGVHEGVTFIKMENNPEYSKFLFIKDGAFAEKRIFKPNGTYLNNVELPDGTTRSETIEEAIERGKTNNLNIVVSILNAVLDKDEFESFAGKDYEDFLAKAQKLLSTKKGVLVNLLIEERLVKGKDGVKKLFPNVPNYSFIEKFQEGQTTKLVQRKAPVKQQEAAGDGLPF